MILTGPHGSMRLRGAPDFLRTTAGGRAPARKEAGLTVPPAAIWEIPEPLSTDRRRHSDCGDRESTIERY